MTFSPYRKRALAQHETPSFQNKKYNVMRTIRRNKTKLSFHFSFAPFDSASPKVAKSLTRCSSSQKRSHLHRRSVFGFLNLEYILLLLEIDIDCFQQFSTVTVAEKLNC